MPYPPFCLDGGHQNSIYQRFPVLFDLVMDTYQKQEQGYAVEVPLPRIVTGPNPGSPFQVNAIKNSMTSALGQTTHQVENGRTHRVQVHHPPGNRYGHDPLLFLTQSLVGLMPEDIVQATSLHELRDDAQVWRHAEPHEQDEVWVAYASQQCDLPLELLDGCRVALQQALDGHNSPLHKHSMRRTKREPIRTEHRSKTR